MSFSANQKNLIDVLTGNFQYFIQKNQRKYVWDEREWQELFEDIFEIEQTDEYKHFIGSIVISNEGVSSNKFNIIDGQQRLITISILFCAIANKFNSIGENDKANSIYKNYILGDEDGDKYCKISRENEMFFYSNLCNFLIDGYKTDDEIEKEFSISFNNRSKYDKSLLNCFIFFSKKINGKLNNESLKIDYLSKLKKKLSVTELIEIRVSNDNDGYRIFETLNARGVPLEQHELIKNYIFSYMRYKTKQDKAYSTWEKILSNLTSDSKDSIKNFIRHYCIHCFEKSKGKNEFKIIRDFTKKDEVEKLLNSLSLCSNYYSLILNPDSLKNTKYYSLKSYIALNFFKKMNIRQVRPFLLSLFEIFDLNKISLNEFSNILETMETFYFLYVILVKFTTNTIDSSITNLAFMMHENSKFDRDEFDKFLNRFLPNIELIENNFKKLVFSNHNKKYKNSSNRRVIEYIFIKIELSSSNQDELPLKIPSIEHILDDSAGTDDVAFIGNLLPLSTKLNKKCKGKTFAQKLDIYKESRFNLTIKFVEKYKDVIDWDDNNINKRSSDLMHSYFSDIWESKLTF